MADDYRVFDDSSEQLPKEIIDLAKHIAKLPQPCRENMDAVYEQVVDSIRRRRRILSLVQEALSQLRLDIKYLMFDLDATKQERDALQEKLEE